ncbi:MAG: glycosyltransferase [Fidelibacterota bacterium]|nr:MAG: glycosyltransferase [Candidatus Neomarinimicrobiota bacterium]
MKILYIAAQNVVGQLELWQKVHNSRGNQCRYITYFSSAYGFRDDICLHLPLVPFRRRATQLRHRLYTRTKGSQGNWTEIPGSPPLWRPKTGIERAFFTFRDWLWRFRVEPAIKNYGLLDYDIYHLEGGLEFYRNGDFVRRLAEESKPIIGTYHGRDFRNRGVIPAVDRHIQLNLTSEYDLLPRHPNLHYLFLPYDVAAHQPARRLHDPITICHATRSRYAKGSETIIAACRSLEASHGIRFIFIENQPHEEAMALKAESDIYIDQVADVAPGYGMNSVEAMALGLACCTSMNADYQAFMPDHPFVNISPGDLLEQLAALIENHELIRERGQAARIWAENHHALEVVGDQLYEYYRRLGIEV